MVHFFHDIHLESEEMTKGIFKEMQRQKILISHVYFLKVKLRIPSHLFHPCNREYCTVHYKVCIVYNSIVHNLVNNQLVMLNYKKKKMCSIVHIILEQGLEGQQLFVNFLCSWGWCP